MKAFHQLNKGWMQRLDFYMFVLSHIILLHANLKSRFSAPSKWFDVVEALQKSMASSTLDELITVTEKRPIRANKLGSRPVFCVDDKDLLRSLLISPHVPLAAPSIAPKQPENVKPRGTSRCL